MRPAPLLLALALASSACGSRDECAQVLCGACAPPVQLKVLDAVSDEELSAATVTGLPGSCVGGTCSLEPTAAGTYALEVSAPGHQARTVSVIVLEERSTGCCRCRFEEQFLAVKLQPDSP